MRFSIVTTSSIAAAWALGVVACAADPIDCSPVDDASTHDAEPSEDAQVDARRQNADASAQVDATAKDGSVQVDAAANDGATKDVSVKDVATDSNDGSLGYDSSKAPEAGPTPDASALNACGICDRVWTCDAATDFWVSKSATECDDIRNGTQVASLFCANGNTINYLSASSNDGYWYTTQTGMSLIYNSLGGTFEVDCSP